VSERAERRTGPRAVRGDKLDQPQEQRARVLPRLTFSQEAFGVLSERFARLMGTAGFLIGMTVFVAAWIVWNTFAPAGLIFDEFPFIFLTLMLSLQASYAAPLILLAQTRQADRDKAHAEADALHREALANASLERQELAAHQAAQIMQLLEENTKLTRLTQELSERIAHLTQEIHRSLQPQPR
jgi:uncharacterized membrane protein